MKAFVDTNILIYADDRNAPSKQHRAARLVDELTEAATGCLSYQVLQEYYANAVRKLRLDPAEASVRTKLYARLGVVPMTQEILWSAIDLHRLELIAFWDALIVRTAQAARCDRIYSEDLQHGRAYDGLRVVNPFA